MEDKDWFIIKTLYEEKNITKAAERLFITQPALTYRLQVIEQELGAKIVNRGKKGIEFTKEGEYVFRYAEKMIYEFQKLKETLQNMDNKIQGTFRLAVTASFANHPLPILLKNFLTLYPDVEIKLVTGWSSEVVQRMRKNEAHLGIIRGDHYWPEAKQTISEEPIIIASKQKITIDQLPHLPRIVYKTDYHLKQVVDNWWYEHFSEPPYITMEVDQIEICRRMVTQGLGYAIFPSTSIVEDEDLFRLNLANKNNEPLVRKTSIIYRDEVMEMAVIKAFVDYLQVELQHL